MILALLFNKINTFFKKISHAGEKACQVLFFAVRFCVCQHVAQQKSADFVENREIDLCKPFCINTMGADERHLLWKSLWIMWKTICFQQGNFQNKGHRPFFVVYNRLYNG